MAGVRSSCTLSPGSPNGSLFTSFLDGASPVIRRKQLEISDILRVSGSSESPEESGSKAEMKMLTTLFGTAAGGALRIPLLPSSTVTVERLIGQRTEGESSRAVARAVGVGREWIWWQRVTLQRVRVEREVGKEERKREETNETRVSTFKPNKIYGIMNHAREICSGRCAHVFTLHLSQEQR